MRGWRVWQVAPSPVQKTACAPRLPARDLLPSEEADACDDLWRACGRSALR